MTHQIITQLANHGYVAILILMILESACIPIPSEVTMLVGGALANMAFVQAVASGHGLNVVAVAVVGTIGNLIGSWIAWGIGHKGGRPLVERYGRYILMNTRHLDAADRWFAKHGAPSVFVARLLPVLRTFISLPAGITQMPFLRFTFFTLLGCLPWTFALAFAGQALGSQWTKVQSALAPLTYVIAVLVLIAIGVWLKKRWPAFRQA